MSSPLLVTARGERYEVGLAHGEQARDLVRGTLAWSLGQLSTGGIGHEEARRRANDLLPYVERAVPELVEEMLRLEAPVAAGRTVVREVALGGVHMRPGDRVLVEQPSANRDSSRSTA